MQNENVEYIVNKLRRWVLLLLAVSGINALAMVLIFVIVLNNQSKTEITQTKPLPGALAEPEEREKLLRSFKSVYNTKDYHGFWLLMSPVFRVRHPESELPDVLRRFYGLAERIEDGSFKNYETVSGSGEVNTYKLHYSIRCDRGSTGSLIVEVSQLGSEPYQCNGFNLSVD